MVARAATTLPVLIAATSSSSRHVAVLRRCMIRHTDCRTSCSIVYLCSTVFGVTSSFSGSFCVEILLCYFLLCCFLPYELLLCCVPFVARTIVSTVFPLLFSACKLLDRPTRDSERRRPYILLLVFDLFFFNFRP
jgi:hypothetical protein